MNRISWNRRWRNGGLLLAAMVCAVAPSPAADDAGGPWQQITHPTAAEVAARFASPPPEYSATVTWGWDGPISEAAIVRDLDALHGLGFRAVTIEAGYRMDNAPYLSDGWFGFVRFAVEQAKARGMRVWIIDEGKYPSGFAGGKFSQERPDLRMRGLGIVETIPVAAGETVVRDLAPEVLGALAVNAQDGSSQALDIAGGRLSWKAPAAGSWSVRLVDHQFRTPVTRAVNDPTGAKTTANSMGDLLDPAAVRQFIEWTHESYKRHLGDEFGKTVLGFRGDEPDFGHVPYTPGILDEFEKRKGYDVRPFVAAFIPGGRGETELRLSDEQRRARADYWEVWSDLFARHFFAQQAEWCAANGVEYMVHLNNEHVMPRLVRSTGDFFRPMRHVQIPGVDAIWNQVWPGRVADFVRLPASAAHLYGRPRVLSESYAAYRDFPITVETARWGVNYQVARGVNLFEFMFYPSSARRGEVALRGYMGEPGFAQMIAYANRVSYLLAQGRPAAYIGLYFPSPSMWLDDFEPERRAMELAAELQGLQRDFDFVDEQALTTVLTPSRNRLRNLSGGGYRAFILPSGAAISRAGLERLRAFAESGGTVIVAGADPVLEFEGSFRGAKPPDPLAWALHAPSGKLDPAALEALPRPDVAFDEPCPEIKYTRRRLADADVYFLFNESEETRRRQVTLRGRGRLEIWDADTGRIAVTGLFAENGYVRSTIELQPGESRIFVIAVEAPAVALR